MSSTKSLLTIFGATGKQGGSIIDTVLDEPKLSQKYALRAVTRDTTSSNAKALAERGVELVQADSNNLEMLRHAIKGSYGVFAVTDFWSILNKQKEITQGKNIFEAAKSEGVKHFIWSSLPPAEKLTQGKLKHVVHADSKAEVEDFIEANKGDLIASYYLPTMYFENIKNMTQSHDGGAPTLALPFASDSVPWPLIDPRRDSGKYIIGLFEAGAKADGVQVRGVSTWTTPKAVVEAISAEVGKAVMFQSLPPEVFASYLPENIRQEVLETMLLAGDYSIYGPGTEREQAESDKWMIEGAELTSVSAWVKSAGPWSF